MRTSAPYVFTLLLACAAGYLYLNKPAPAQTPPTAVEEPTVPVATPAEAPPEAAGVTAEEPTEQAAMPGDWPQEESDIPVDPRYSFGELSNGMRYVIRHNAEPPGRVSVRLHIAAGSLMEADNQQGLAHFLEHMVFNGSKHFKPDELVPRMQRLGIAFGAHANAYTSFDETVYMLDLPETSDELLDLGFTVMRDFADGALLEPEEIDKERGVILSEKTSRDSVGFRIMKQQFANLLPDSMISHRFPIGEEEIISKAPRERFTEFYTGFYTPRRMTFVVVGDVEPEAMEQRIRDTFGSMLNPDSPQTNPDRGKITVTNGLDPLVFTDKELPDTGLALMLIEPYESETDTRAQRGEDLRMALAEAMIGLRFERLAKKPGAPILDGGANKTDLFREAWLGSVEVQVADDEVEAATKVLENEFRRVLEFGFTASELREASANVLNGYEQAVKTDPSRKSPDIATAVVRSLNARRVLSSPETNLEIVKHALEGITPADCQKAFEEFWEGRKPRLIFTAPQAPGDIAQKLEEWYLAGASEKLEAPEDVEAVPFAYTDFGPPGRIEDEQKAEDLDVTRWTFANGVTVNLKPTDFAKGQISLLARVGHGRLTLPADKIGLADFTNSVVNNSGIGVHSAEELERIVAGHTVGTGFGISEDAFVIVGNTTPDDLLLQLQLMAAQLLHPALREEAIDQYRKQLPITFQQLAHTPQGSGQKMNAWLHGDDPRYQYPEEIGVLLAYTAADAQAWLDKSLAGAPVELNVVGDFDITALQEAVMRTFGALDKRPAKEALPAKARLVHSPAGPATKEYTFESKIPQGQAIAAWQIPAARKDQKLFRRFNLLASILDDRLREKIREELGASYSPQALAESSSALDDYGYLLTASVGTPEDLQTLLKASVEMGEKLAAEGASEDEFQRALSPILGELQKSLRDNRYWLQAVLSGSTEDAEKWDLARGRLDDYQSIKLAELNALAKEHIGSGKALQISISPKE